MTNPRGVSGNPKRIGTFYTNTQWVPRTVRAGSTVYIRTWYMERSKDTLVAQDFGLDLWNRATPIRGVSVSWLNPLTHRWQASTYTDHHGYFALGLQKEPTLLAVAPGRWAHIDVRITFSKSAYKGTWHIMPEPASGYGLRNSAGTFDWAFLDSASSSGWPQYTTNVRP
ncbi:hypothetical protein [Streptacidiphilus sp. EB129]|uniref:hypothetical protein n=1 Tax=Streptacidiphilus sp. EB129 TaxID=3156262 RepID=UPI0035160CD5